MSLLHRGVFRSPIPLASDYTRPPRINSRVGIALAAWRCSPLATDRSGPIPRPAGLANCASAFGRDRKVYAGRNGIIGALTEDLIDTVLDPKPRSRRSNPSRCHRGATLCARQSGEALAEFIVPMVSASPRPPAAIWRRLTLAKPIRHSKMVYLTVRLQNVATPKTAEVRRLKHRQFAMAISHAPRLRPSTFGAVIPAVLAMFAPPACQDRQAAGTGAQPNYFLRLSKKQPAHELPRL